MPFGSSIVQTFKKGAAVWRRHGAVPLAVGLGALDVAYSNDRTSAAVANAAQIAVTYGLRKSPRFWMGALAPLATYGAVRGGMYLGKSDREHNTLEGFQENGVAGKSRKSYGFGSGWMGTPASLMGQAIDPDILAYREDVMDVRSARKALYARIHQAEEASLARMGSLSGPDYMAANIERLKGINTQREGLQAINLSRFNVEVDDADTLVLKRGGIASFFDKEIQIRLAGIDAPETAGHAGDPLAEVRFWQAQPGGEEASERLREIMGTGEGFQVIVGPEKTYGRYLGAIIGPDGENINVQLAREGMVAALPFGEAEKEVVQRGPVGRAQAEARAEEAGIWGMARYKAIAQAQEAIGQPITYNTMTRLDKLSQNLNLGAYASFLQDMGTERRALTPEELHLSHRMGYSLRKSHGSKRFNKAKNPIKGHDSGHWGRDKTFASGDFEPGQSVRWIYRAMEAGVSKEAIAEAGSRMGAGIVSRSTARTTLDMMSMSGIRPATRTSDIASAFRATTDKGIFTRTSDIASASRTTDRSILELNQGKFRKVADSTSQAVLQPAAAASGRGIAEIAQSLKGAGSKETLKTIQREFQVKIGTGERFIRGRTIGAGAFKEMSLAHQFGRQEPVVLGEALSGGAEAVFGKGAVKGLPAEAMHIGDAAQMARKGMEHAQSAAKEIGAKNPLAAKEIINQAEEVLERVPFRQKLALKTGMPTEATVHDVGYELDAILGKQAQAIGGKTTLSLAGEAELQREARKALGDVVPGVIGTTDRGFIQEYAGKTISTPLEIHERAQRITSKYTSLKNTADPLRHERGHARRVESMMEKGLFSSPIEQTVHLDMHMSNVTYRGSKMKVIDWGMSLVGQNLSRQQKDLLLSAQKASSIDRMYGAAADFGARLRGNLAPSKAAGDTFNPRAWRETVQRRLLKTNVPVTPSLVGTAPAISRMAGTAPAISSMKASRSSHSADWVRQLQRNRVQSEASGIGLKLNASRNGSKKM